jgi:hypothetical protein
VWIGRDCAGGDSSITTREGPSGQVGSARREIKRVSPSRPPPLRGTPTSGTPPVAVATPWRKAPPGGVSNMDGPRVSLRRLARFAGVLAGFAGGYGFLVLMGAFGPISCSTSRSSSDGTGSEAGVTTVTRDCEAGVDYLLGATSGNAPVLFFWAVVLLGLTGVGVFAVWTGRRRVVWATTGIGLAITIVGVFSIGWQFLLPTLFLGTAATALTVAARREAK